MPLHGTHVGCRQLFGHRSERVVACQMPVAAETRLPHLSTSRLTALDSQVMTRKDMDAETDQFHPGSFNSSRWTSRLSSTQTRGRACPAPRACPARQGPREHKASAGHWKGICYT